MNRVENQSHSGFAGAFLAADILRHKALRDAHATRQRRHIQFRMCHKELVKRCGLWLVKEALETQVFVQLLPMDSEVVCRKINKLFFCGITQTGIVRKKLASLFAIKRAMEAEPRLKVTLPNLVEDKILENLF